jgi:hypothetical protein
MALLKKAFPEAKVVFASEMPRWFFKYFNKPMDNALDIASQIDCDLAVFAGMAMCPEFINVNGPTIRSLRTRDVPVLLMGTGAQSYGDADRSTYSKFLQDIKPLAFISRDDHAYEMYQDSVEIAYPGIDCAWFIAEAYQPADMVLKNKLLILNFDSYQPPPMEDLYELEYETFRKQNPNIGVNLFVFRSHHNCWTPPTAGQGTDHIYDNEEPTLISDIPYDYLTLYAARFYNPTPRGHLFKTMGAEDAIRQSVKLDMNILRRKQGEMIAIVKQVVDPIFEMKRKGLING